MEITFGNVKVSDSEEMVGQSQMEGLFWQNRGHSGRIFGKPRKVVLLQGKQVVFTGETIQIPLEYLHKRRMHRRVTASIYFILFLT